MLYKGNLGGKKFYISYSFTDNKLSRVVYIYNETHSNDNNYITSYDELKEVLTTKYQELRSAVTWKNDLFKDDEDKWGLAISAGHLALKSIWETENTNITLACAGENYEITLGIVYTGKSYFDLLKSERDKKT